MNYQKEKYGEDARTVNTSSTSTEIYKNKVDATKNQELSNELFVVETNDRLVLFNFFSTPKSVCVCTGACNCATLKSSLRVTYRYLLPIYYIRHRRPTEKKKNNNKANKRVKKKKSFVVRMNVSVNCYYHIRLFVVHRDYHHTPKPKAKSNKFRPNVAA